VGKECCGRASGGVSGRLPVPGLVEVVVRDGLGIDGVVLGALVDAVLGHGRVHLFTPLLGMKLVEVEFGLGRPPGRMEEGRRGGLTDMGEDLRDGHGIGEKRDEREGGAAGRADQRERLIDASQECGPPGRPGVACGWGFRRGAYRVWEARPVRAGAADSRPVPGRRRHCPREPWQ